MSLAFQITKGSDKGQVFLFADGFIGTLPQCSMRLCDPSIAPLQAKLTYRNGSFVVADLTDAPDLLVNDLRVKTRALAKGDIVRMAGVEMTVIETSETAVPQIIVHNITGPVFKSDDAAPSITQQLQLHLPEAAPARPPPPTPAISQQSSSEVTKALEGYRERSQNMESAAKSSESRSILYVLLVCIIVLPLAILIGFILNQRGAEKQMTAFYQEACTLAARPETEPQVAIDAFVKLRNLAHKTQPGIANRAAAKIAELEKNISDSEAAFQAQLQQLDAAADDLAAKGEFGKAAEIYNSTDWRLAKRIRDARAPKLEEWKQRAQASSAASVAATPAVEAEVKSRPDLDAQLSLILISTVDLALDGKIDDANKELGKITPDQFPAETVTLAQETITSLHILGTLDRIQQETGSMPTNQVLAAPSLIRTFLALRRKDMLEAQGMIKKIPQELLSTELSKRAQMSEEEARKENHVATGFAAILSSIMGENIASIPKPEDCIHEINSILAEGQNKKLPEYFTQMRDLQERNPESRFIARYTPVFALCRTLITPKTVSGSQKSSLGDGRIIAVKADEYYVELNIPPPDPSKSLAGLFREKNIYYDLATSNMLASRVEVLAAVPFKLLGENQAMFSVPTGILQTIKPIVGDKVLLAPDLKPGIRLILPDKRQEQSTLYNLSKAGNPGKEWTTSWKTSQSDKDRFVIVSPRNKNQIVNTELTYKADGPDILVEALLHCTDHFKIILAPGIALAFPPSRASDSGLFFNGHLAQPWSGAWNQTSEYHRVGFKLSANCVRGFADDAICEAAIPLTEVKANTGKLGFQSSSELRFRSLLVSKPQEAGKPQIIGIDKTGLELLIHRGDSTDWKKLANNSAIYLLDKASTADPAKGPGALQCVTVAAIMEQQDDHFIASIPKPVPITVSTRLSLTANPAQQTGAEDNQQRPILLGTAWNPQQLIASAQISKKNTPVLIPQFPGTLTPKAFLVGTSGSIVHPHSSEILALSIGSATPVELEEKNGVLSCPQLVSLLPAAQTTLPFVLSRTLMEAGSSFDAAGLCMQIPAVISSSSNPGWQSIKGNWRTKMGRLTNTEATETAIIRLPGVLWRNVQYDFNFRIEKAATSTSTNQEILVDLYLPFLRGGFSFALGSRGAEISGSRINQHNNSLSSGADLPAGANITFEPGFGSKAPILVANQNYNIRIRRAGDICALYINGKRIATVSCPGFSGDTILHIANPAGSISMDRARAMNLGNSATIPAKEPDTGEFGYILSVNGTSAIVDSDGFGLVPQAKVSIMKVSNVIKGDVSKTIVLNRVATGTVTDSGLRTARIALSTPLNMEKGLKVVPGAIPETMTWTGDRITDVSQGF